MNMLPVQSNVIPLTLPAKNTNEVAEASTTFSNMLSKTINQVNQAQNNSETAIAELHTGSAKNLHDVMIATEEADIAIRMLVQMRNKALEAYNEIMRLQI